MRRKTSVLRSLIAIIALSSISVPLAVSRPTAAEGADKLTENQKIIHILNRLGFGPRPGDVERVRSMGVEKYIDEQLNAASIDDTAAEHRVDNLEVFSMTTAELFAKYPNPGALLRQLEGGNQQRRNQAAGANPQAPAQPESPEEQQRQQRERRQKLEELYRQYNLRPAGQILPQIVGNRVIRAAYSEKQLQEVMVDFWQNHFNVFSGKAAVRWYIPSYERDVLRKNALGNFRDLVVGTARHPAMLFYLDNFESVAPIAQNRGNNRAANRVLRQIQSGNITPGMREQIKRQRGITDAELDAFIRQARNNPQAGQQRNQRGLNENYARELMELHTLGVDGGYTQKDIIEVARAFTGWTIADPRGFRRSAAEMITGSDQRGNRGRQAARLPGNVESGEFYFNANWHDKDPKFVLGQKVDAGGVNDGMKVIDLLVEHPSTAKFIARKLAVKFVSDNPDEAFVGRIAAAFQKSHGDIKTTLRAIFTDKEFFAPKNYRAKIKTPFELVVSSIRALNAQTNASPALLAMLNKLGEVPYGYQAPTGYPDTAEDWVNTGALLERLNFAIAVSSNRIPGTRVDLRGFSSDNKSGILDKAVAQILNGEIAPETRDLLVKRYAQPLPEVTAGNQIDDDPEEMPNMAPPGARAGMNRQARLLNPTGNPDIFKAVSLVLGTPEFQRQ